MSGNAPRRGLKTKLPSQNGARAQHTRQTLGKSKGGKQRTQTHRKLNG